MPEPEDVALFDMDGTLCDYDVGLLNVMKNMLPPDVPLPNMPIRSSSPEYIRNLSNLIRSSEDWWANLPKRQLGFDVLNLAERLGYSRMILTQGPMSNPRAWSGKKIWLDKHLPGMPVTMTRDKGLVYGRVLVDDFPEYAERWLTWRKNGLVVMPATEDNARYAHPQVIRYDGTNLAQVEEAMSKARRK